ncbi:uncharacterized protein LOC126653984 isoform X2 [Mercurialis annua]|uniref:uncharacterized protein LOC126653984 isoform X2 n=1 Tax=Mercurialis annua TaxID=3986 RepID=UPI00215E23D6|nr:uncharacterized protein LOC126653984 isoform X2 [Mercurialis annua]
MMPQSSIQHTDAGHFFQTINGLQQLAETRRFKAWLLDQFGVLHDGKQSYPGAISTSLGKSCIHMTWGDRGAISLEGLGLRIVENVEEAEFILAHGTEALGQSSGAACPMTLEELEKILEHCAGKGIPMVVANPDFVTVEARNLRVMPGTLASKYEKLGGEVKWMGKPDKIIYKSAMAMAGVDAVDSIAVGDSLHHDIKGANAAGIRSAFITGGIHATELGLGSFGEVADLSSVKALASKYDAYPSYILPSFTW